MLYTHTHEYLRAHVLSNWRNSRIISVRVSRIARSFISHVHTHTHSINMNRFLASAGTHTTNTRAYENNYFLSGVRRGPCLWHWCPWWLMAMVVVLVEMKVIGIPAGCEPTQQRRLWRQHQPKTRARVYQELTFDAREKGTAMKYRCAGRAHNIFGISPRCHAWLPKTKL